MTFPESSQISVDISAIDLRGYRTVTMTVIVQKGSRAKHASVQLEVVNYETLPVEMVAVHSSAVRVWLNASLGMDAEAPGEENTWEDATFSWELSWVGRGLEVPRAGMGLLPSEAVPTGWNKPSLMLNVAALGLGEVLGPGSAFMLRVRAQSGERGGEAALQFNVGRGPSAGVCASAPTTAEAFLDEVVTLCTEWAAADLPLQFRFGTNSTWTAWSYLSWFSGVYPAGVHRMRAEVRDASGVSKLSNATLVHVHEPKLCYGTNCTVVLGGDREIVFQNLRSTADALQRLKRMPTLLQMSILFMSTLNKIEELKGMEEWGSMSPSELPRRRLLSSSSSAEYRTRVRNLLLRKCAATVQGAASELSSTAIIDASTTLARQPEEVFHQVELATLVDVGSSYVLADELRIGWMQKALLAVDSVIAASEGLDQVRYADLHVVMGNRANQPVPLQSGFNTMLLTALRSLTRLSLSYLSSMDLEVVYLLLAPAWTFGLPNLLSPPYPKQR